MLVPNLLPTDVPPLYWRREFPGAALHVRSVRWFVACLLDGCPFLDDVLLAVDELAVNALRHTKSGQPDGRFTVVVLSNGDAVVVSVSDQGGPDEPVALDADALAESGRGLRAISRTAVSWGWHGNESGRTVSAVFTAGGRDADAGSGTVGQWRA